MRRLIVVVVSVAALVAGWTGLLRYAPPRQVEPMAAKADDADIALYLRLRSEGHLVGRYH
jgi:hypothetical protein